MFSFLNAVAHSKDLEVLAQAQVTQVDMQCSLDALVMIQREQGEALQRLVQAIEQMAATQQQVLENMAAAQRGMMASLQEFVALAMELLKKKSFLSVVFYNHLFSVTVFNH